MQYHEKTVFHWCHLQKIPEHIPFHKWDQDDHRCQNTVEQDRKGVVSSLHRLFGDHAVNTIAKAEQTPRNTPLRFQTPPLCSTPLTKTHPAIASAVHPIFFSVILS